MNISRFASDYGPDLSAVASFSFVAIVEWIFSFSLDDHSLTFYVARSTSGLFLILAVLLICDIVRLEHQHHLGTSHD
jgi:hypothetical protein